MNHITQERHEHIHPDNIISDLPLLPLTVVTTVYVCMYNKQCIYLLHVYVVVKNSIRVKIQFLCLLTLIRVRRQRKLRIKLSLDYFYLNLPLLGLEDKGN